jgi:hypothetical protein
MPHSVDELRKPLPIEGAHPWVRGEFHDAQTPEQYLQALTRWTYPNRTYGARQPSYYDHRRRYCPGSSRSVPRSTSRSNVSAPFPATIATLSDVQPSDALTRGVDET